MGGGDCGVRILLYLCVMNMDLCFFGMVCVVNVVIVGWCDFLNWIR